MSGNISKQSKFEKMLFYLLIGTSGIYIPLFSIGSISIRFFEVIALLWLSLYGIFRTNKIYVTYQIKLFYLLLFSLLISMLLINAHISGFILLIRIFFIFMISIMIQVCTIEEKMLLRAVDLFLYSGLLVIIIGLISFFLANNNIYISELLLETTFSGKGFRIQSFLPGSNRFGNYAAIIFSVFTVKMLLSENIRSKEIVSTIISFSGLLLSGSRGALLSSALSLSAIFLIYLIINRDKVLIGRLLVLLLIVVLAILTITLKVEVNIFTRFTEYGSGGTSGISSNIRFVYLNKIIERLFSSVQTLFFGIGYYGQENYLTIGDDYFSPHNTYLVILTAQGLLGLLLYLTIILKTLILGWKTLLNNKLKNKNQKNIIIPLLAGFVTIIIHFNSIGLYTTGYVWVYINLVIASFRRENMKIKCKVYPN